jgi:hypothetical protein
MLPGKRNMVAIYTVSANKKIPVMMEAREGICKLVKCGGGDGVAACNVAEVKKC